MKRTVFLWVGDTNTIFYGFFFLLRQNICNLYFLFFFLKKITISISFFFFWITGFKTNIIASGNLSLELYSKIRKPLLFDQRIATLALCYSKVELYVFFSVDISKVFLSNLHRGKSLDEVLTSPTLKGGLAVPSENSLLTPRISRNISHD